MSTSSKLFLSILMLLHGILHLHADQKIIAGDLAKMSFLKRHVVSLRLMEEDEYGDTHFCGGTIIGVKTILTAAHCLYTRQKRLQPEDIVVVAGNTELSYFVTTEQRRLVHSYTVHYNWRKKFDWQADIAIVRLTRQLYEDKVYVQHIELNKDPIVIGEVCSVAGWGRSYRNGPISPKLLYALLKIKKADFCGGPRVTRQQICALDEKPADGDSAMCDGDDGAPFVCNGQLTGIGSRNTGQCQNFNYFTSIYTHRDWIKKNFRSSSSSKGSFIIGLLILAFVTAMIC